MSYHVIIKEERRKDRLATEHEGQLHNIGESIADMDSEQIVYCAEWNGDELIVHKGDPTALTMMYAGWPNPQEVTNEEDNTL
jgi:hypothetical protein